MSASVEEPHAPNPPEDDEPGPTFLRGELRRHPGSQLREFFLVISLVAAGRAALELLARALLGRRQRGTLELRDAELLLREETSYFGRVLRRRESRLALEDVVEVGSEFRSSTRALFVGLFSTAVGTAFGTFVLVESTRAGGLAFAGIGAAGIAAGLLVDYALTRSSPREQAPALWARLRSGRAFRLQSVEKSALERFLRRVAAESPPRPRDAEEPGELAVS